MYAFRASSAGFGGPPAPAHIVSSMNTGPRGMNGASPFISAHPDRDIDSTPAARPIESSSLRIACAIEIAPDSEEAQKRFTVIAGTESGKPAASAAQRPTSPIPSCATLTQPAVMSSIRSTSTPTRSQAATIVWPRRSSRRMWASDPPYLPIGVRTPPRMNASGIDVALLVPGNRERPGACQLEEVAVGEQRDLHRDEVALRAAQHESRSAVEPQRSDLAHGPAARTVPGRGRHLAAE